MLVTLKDAADYITKLPKKESDLPEWQAAIEALMLCSRGGDPMLARIGVMRALNRGVERVFNPDRKDIYWGKRKLKRVCLRQWQQIGRRPRTHQAVRDRRCCGEMVRGKATRKASRSNTRFWNEPGSG